MPGVNPYPRLRACLPARAASGEWFSIGPYDLLLRKNGSIDLRRAVRMRHGWRYRVDRVSKRGITYFQGFRPITD